jgi:hypothetical protein
MGGVMPLPEREAVACSFQCSTSHSRTRRAQVSHVDAPTETTQDAVSERATDTHLHGRWLLLIKIVWGVLVAIALGMFVVSLPGYIAQLQTLCTGASCSSGQLSADGLTSLEHLGLSLGEYVAFNVALMLIATLVGYALALVLVLRRSDDWMALLVALMLVFLVSGSIASPVVLSNWVGPVFASILFSILGYLGFISVVLVFYLFPDGRFIPRWTRWVVLGVIGVSLPFSIIPYSSTVWLTVVSTLIFSGTLISLVIAQIYRYRRVSFPLQRQQTKWVVYSLTVAILPVVGLVLLPQLLVPSIGQTGSLSASITTIIANLLLFFLLPLAFGIAILRYRLYDIDVIINRTLVYGTLTVILTGVYVGLVIGLQALLRGIISQDSGIAIVISTLAIAALFQPLRRRIQKIIDRRFYRSKYDAAKIIEAFSATLRNQVDLNTLSEQLVAVVEETMQPTFVSLWLRSPAHTEKRKPWRANPPVSSEGR